MIKCFYTLYDDEENMICTLENLFNEKYENPSAPIFQKIKKDEELENDDFCILSDYLFAQYFRTPAMFEDLALVFPEVFKETVKETIKRLRINGKIDFPDSKEIYHADKHYIWNSISVIRDKNGSSAIGVFTRALYIECLNAMLSNDKVSESLKQYNWILLKAPDDIIYPTSDKPVSICAVDSKQHFSDDIPSSLTTNKSIIFMPLDPKHLMFTQVGWDKVTAKNFTPSKNFHKALVEYIIHSSRLYIYSKEVLDNIEDIRPRQVDEELYVMQNNNLLNFDQIQKNYERGTSVNVEAKFFV